MIFLPDTDLKTFLRGAFPTTCAAFLLILPSAARSQPVPDTLDWRGYFPLVIGNSWQYHVESWHGAFGTVDEYLQSWTIIGDTTIDAATFFVVDTVCDSLFTWPGLGNNPCNTSEDRFMLAYNEASRNLEIANPNRDSTVEISTFLDDFDLSAPFDSSNAQYEYSRSEEPRQIGDDEIETTVKRIGVFSAVPGGYQFAHGIGLLSASFSEGAGTDKNLIHAQVGDISYGAFRVHVSGPAQLVDFDISVFPNPASNGVQIEYTSKTFLDLSLIVYDVLGRRRLYKHLGSKATGTNTINVDTKGLESGWYHAVLSSGDLPRATAKLIIL